MSGFSIAWLDLRESADNRARNDELLAQAQQWLSLSPELAADNIIVDLGSGTGSTLRAFSADGSKPGSFFWRLVDQDAALLAEARERHGSSCQLETFELDLTDIPALPLNGASLVTASALFDLVSAGFLDSLTAAIQAASQQHAIGFYAALNYDGDTSWTPAHPLDAAVLEAFNRDQQRDKGFGQALGPDASDYMEQLFKQAGYHVICAPSPWLLDGQDHAMVKALIEGIGNAVAQDTALDPAALKDWVLFRQAHAATGTCTVGHTDLLALPAA